MTTDFRPPVEQKFACRDCPARCCTTPWKIGISEEEKQRYEATGWIRQRLEASGTAFRPIGGGKYALPMVERERKLTCLFLDEDNLCSQYKHGGPEFWPQTCQLFPFGFVRDENGEVRPSLSHHCPSIRDSYGEALAPQLPKYFASAEGKAADMAGHMTLQGRIRLERAAYVPVLHRWEALLSGAPTAAAGLLAVFDLTTALTGQLLDSEAPDAGEVEEALREAGTPASEIPRAGGDPLLPRLVLSLSLSALTYPMRLVTEGRLSPRKAWMTLRSTMRLVKSRGEIDLLMVPRPVELAEAMRLPAPLGEPELAAAVKAYFVLALDRRNLFTAPRDLGALVLDLVMAHAVIGRVARYHAVANGSDHVTLADLREGISIAECLYLYHFSTAAKPPMLETLQALLATNRPALTRLLADAGTPPDLPADS